MTRSLRHARPDPGMADDGDALNFCSTCAFSSACISQGYDKASLQELHVLVDHVGPFPEGSELFREGDPFNAIAAVRAGMVKTYVTDTTAVRKYWASTCRARSSASMQSTASATPAMRSR